MKQSSTATLREALMCTPSVAPRRLNIRTSVKVTPSDSHKWLHMERGSRMVIPSTRRFSA